jgi:hypothetical protein
LPIGHVENCIVIESVPYFYIHWCYTDRGFTVSMSIMFHTNLLLVQESL